jgi:hypothetical protein
MAERQGFDRRMQDLRSATRSLAGIVDPRPKHRCITGLFLCIIASVGPQPGCSLPFLEMQCHVTVATATANGARCHSKLICDMDFATAASFSVMDSCSLLCH